MRSKENKSNLRYIEDYRSKSKRTISDFRECLAPEFISGYANVLFRKQIKEEKGEDEEMGKLIKAAHIFKKRTLL